MTLPSQSVTILLTACVSRHLLKVDVRVILVKNTSISLTPWSRVLTEKPSTALLVTKHPAFYGTREFITTFIRTHQWTLSSARNPPQYQDEGPPNFGCPRLLIRYTRFYPQYLQVVSSIRKLSTPRVT